MTRKNPERTAWVVILGAFCLFLILCGTAPLSVWYYLRHATTSKPATLDVIGGTVRVSEPGVAAPLGVTKSVALPEGSVIETDENSRGIVTFLDGSTMILFPATQVTLREMNLPTFPWGVEPVTLIIDLRRGSLRVGAAPQIQSGAAPLAARQFEIDTPQLVAKLIEGSYRIVVEADSSQSQVSVTNGAATVTAQGSSVTVNRGQRTVARANSAPIPPTSAAQDLMVNGDFKDPLPRGWDILRDAGVTPGSVTGSVKVISADERQALQIVRSNAGTTSAITGIIQQINKEVSDYRTLSLQADVRVHDQSLSGGGILSSEYPIILRLKYRDVYGSDAEWVHGFYIQNTTNNPTLYGEKVSPDVWVPFESGNLFDTADPRPFYITSLQIYASGWDYAAAVTAVRLIAQ